MSARLFVGISYSERTSQAIDLWKVVAGLNYKYAGSISIGRLLLPAQLGSVA